MSAKCDEVLKVRSAISDYWLIKQPEPTPVPKLLPTNTAKNSSFKPKLGNNQSDPPKYSAVFITNIVHPNHMYMQLDDKDLPSYHHMLEELQKEFCTATKQSPSHCPSPVAGKSGLCLNKKLHILYFICFSRQSLCPPIRRHVAPSLNRETESAHGILC